MIYEGMRNKSVCPYRRIWPKRIARISNLTNTFNGLTNISNAKASASIYILEGPKEICTLGTGINFTSLFYIPDREKFELWIRVQEKKNDGQTTFIMR